MFGEASEDLTEPQLSIAFEWLIIICIVYDEALQRLGIHHVINEVRFLSPELT